MDAYSYVSYERNGGIAMNELLEQYKQEHKNLSAEMVRELHRFVNYLNEHTTKKDN